MKKTIVILLVIISIFVASCSVQSPQVTVTSEVIVTSLPPTETPIPTPTLHPQFISLQDQIAASDEGFALLPDGTVQDGGVSVPGLQVDPKGVMTIDVEGKEVVVDPTMVHFGPDGLSIDGYDDLNDDGVWTI